MTAARPGRLALATALLALAAGAVLLSGARRDPAEAARTAAAFHLTGGLGGGSATSLVACPAAWDSGTAEPCLFAFEPSAGATAYCPHHGGVSLRR